MRNIRKLLSDRRGVGSIEYALIASLISVAAIAAYDSLGDKVGTSFSNVDQALDGAI
jgi:pilus assembly protein Flp/PilA